MNGRDALRLSGDVRTPGSASRANARTNGNDAFRLSKTGCAAAERVGELLDRAPERLVLGGERAGEEAEVRDQLATGSHSLSRQPAEDPREPGDHPAQVAFLRSAERLGDLRRVAAGSGPAC